MSVINVTTPTWDGLPCEVRTQIYRLLFIADKAVIPGQPVSLSTQILRCNKTIYDEAHLLLWHNIFDISEAEVLECILDISNPATDNLKLESSPEHLPLLLWSRQVRHIRLFYQRDVVFQFYFKASMRTLSVMPKLESYCIAIRETGGVSDQPYWTKSGTYAPYALRGLPNQSLALIENFIRSFPSVKLYLAMKTLQGKILRWEAQYHTTGTPGSCITFVDRTPKQELLVHASRASLGPPSRKLVMDRLMMI